MNEISPTIRLRDFMPGSDGWGNKQGKEVFDKLRSAVASGSKTGVIRISLDGVSRTDASFPRESVVSLARTRNGSLAFCLVDVEDEDLLDNWDAAALKLDQPLVCWTADDAYRVLGPPPTPGNSAVFEFLMTRAVVTASQVATALGLKLTNASMKLKQLLQQGLAIRVREVAPSGGLEFLYHRIS